MSLSKTHRDIMEHALGCAQGEPGAFRNHYATEPGCDNWDDIQYLVTLGAMRPGSKVPGGLQYFHVTELGIKALLANR